MCNAHPQVFPCKHTVNTFWFCPNAPFDVQTGRNLGPCRNVNYLNPAEASGDCNLVHCHFRELGGIWVCCQCGNGPQTTGWCTSPTWQWNYDWNNKVWGWVSLSCGHMCCETCVPYDPENPPNPPNQEQPPPYDGDGSAGSAGQGYGQYPTQGYYQSSAPPYDQSYGPVSGAQ